MPITFKKNPAKAPKEEPAQEVEEVQEVTKVTNSAAAKLKKPTPEDVIADKGALENLKENGLAHTLVEKSTSGKKTSSEANTEIIENNTVMQLAEIARVSVTLGTKINTGDWNSVNLSVTLTLPCKVAEVDEVFVYAAGWAEERLSELAVKATSEPEASDE